MESKVKLSTFSMVLTLAVTGLFIFGLYDTYGTSKFPLLALLIILILIFSLFYAPVKVTLSDEHLIMHHPVKKTKLALKDIYGVESYQPTMGEIRLIGSGGYFGHWGMFRAGGMGRYIGFYGKSSDCFMIRMKNGDKYVFGCQNPSEIIDALSKRIETPSKY